MSSLVTNITIGNWYLVRRKPTRISASNVVWAFRDGCSPIPLTSGILEENGIQREGGVCYWHDENHSMAFFFWNEDRIELLISNNGDNLPYTLKLDVKYVHQLQDAMRLANISKEIKL